MVKPKEWVKESFEQSLTQIFFVISRTAHKKVTILKCEIETSKGRPIFSGTNFLLQKAYFKLWRLQRNKIISSWMNVLIEGRSYLLVYKYPKNRRIWYVKQMKKKTTFLLVEILVLKLSLHKSPGEMPFRLHFGFVRLFKMHFRIDEGVKKIA